MNKKDHKQFKKKLEICEEPEIQFLIPSSDLAHEIEAWLLERGAQLKKSKGGKLSGPKRDSCVYLDSDNFDLLNEGCEYRVKEKGVKFRHDLKTPFDTHDTIVNRDENDIFWRYEFKFEDEKQKPSLKPFFGQALLDPVLERSHDFFDLKPTPRFRSSFFKTKYDMDVGSVVDDGDELPRVEYSFQEGHLETLDRSRRTPHMHILELERREGIVEGLLYERAGVKAKFEAMGLVLLPRRKLLMGFELLMPEMTATQRAVYERVLERTEGASAAPIMRERMLAAG